MEEGSLKINGKWEPKKSGKTEAIISVNICDYINLNMIRIVNGGKTKWVNFPCWTTNGKIYRPYYSFDSENIENEIKSEILKLYELGGTK